MIALPMTAPGLRVTGTTLTSDKKTSFDGTMTMMLCVRVLFPTDGDGTDMVWD